jgi:hypothetical protein
MGGNNFDLPKSNAPPVATAPVANKVRRSKTLSWLIGQMFLYSKISQAKARTRIDTAMLSKRAILE